MLFLLQLLIFLVELGVIKWIDQPSLVPFITCIEEQDKKSFREFVIQRMIEETRQDNGTCFETFRRINLLAQK
jgi:trans-aconitate methyltransferase